MKLPVGTTFIKKDKAIKGVIVGYYTDKRHNKEKYSCLCTFSSGKKGMIPAGDNWKCSVDMFNTYFDILSLHSQGTVL